LHIGGQKQTPILYTFAFGLAPLFFFQCRAVDQLVAYAVFAMDVIFLNLGVDIT
jgi:hypothetical protein